jgi:hypothetical protein
VRSVSRDYRKQRLIRGCKKVKRRASNNVYAPLQTCSGKIACVRLVNGVLADPTEGPDSALYEAFGYTRKSERKSGLTRASKTRPTT